jgi:hypothetical protein
MDNDVAPVQELVDKHFANAYDRIDAWAVLNQYAQLKKLNAYSEKSNQAKVEIETENWKLTGAIDRLVEDGLGGCSILERKTTAEPIEPGSAYWDRVQLNRQLHTYAYWAVETGLVPRGQVGMQYEVIRKPSKTVATVFDRTKPLAEYAERVFEWAKSPSKTLAARIPCPVPLEDVQAFAVGLEVATHLVGELKEASGANSDTPPESFWLQNEQACKDYGGCEYRKVCTKQCGFLNNPDFKRSRWAEGK